MLAVKSAISLRKELDRLSPFVGNTPLFPITKVYNKPGVKIYAKLEWMQMGGSVKARPAFNMIKEAVNSGDLGEGRHLLDATSGNTGVAYATFGAALGIPVTLCVPENVSKQKRMALQSLGVNMILTSKFEGTDGAQEKARELFDKYPDMYFYSDQYANDNNWKSHFKSTALEIFAQTNGGVTHFVAGLGTTGTFIGTGRGLQHVNPDITLVASHPDSAMHGLEGWKHLETAKVPLFYDETVADEHIEIDTMQAYELVRKTAELEGILLSPSSAANLAGAIKVADEIDEGVVVTVFPDHGSNYPEVISMIFED